MRNLYIDNVKGLAIISIVILHVLFYNFNGPIKYIFFIFETPIFFLASGLTSSNNIKKNTKRLILLEISYILFIIPIFLILLPTKYHISLNSLFNLIIHKNYLSIFEIGDSFWFLKTYFPVSFFGVILIKYLNYKQINILLIILLLIIIIISYPEIVPYPINHLGHYLGYTQFIIFYLFIFFIGHQCKNIIIKKPNIFLGYTIIAATIATLYLIHKEKIFNIQHFKFPPQFVYLAISSISLFTILILKDRIVIKRKSILTFIGQNSIYFYFAQALGTFVIILIHRYFSPPFHWYLPLIYISISLSLTFIFAFIIKKYINYCIKLIGIKV